MEAKTKILFTGDFYGGGRVEELIISEKFIDIYNDFVHEIRTADISITNLEAPITNVQQSIPKTGPALRAPLSTAKALNFAGFNLVTLANNHIMDYGAKGLADTFEALKNEKIEFIGAGKNLEEAQRPVFKTINGLVLGFINIAENEWSTTHGTEFGANPLNPVQNYYAIQEAKKKSDYLFVIIHGGHEMYSLPSPRMKETYRFIIDAGADAVIGHHTHCISGYEIYKDGFIFYSLGNFIFDKGNKGSRMWNEGYAVRFDVSKKNITFNLIPYIQNGDQVGIILFEEDGNSQFLKKISELNEIILDDTMLKDRFDSFCKGRKAYNFYLEPHNSLLIYFLQKHKLMSSLLSKGKRLLLKNLIRCESHREVVINLLEK